MLDARLDEGLVDGQLCGHYGVIGGGEHGLDAGSDQGLGSHLHLGGGGAVLLNVLDAVGVAEGLCVCNGLGGGILTQVVQQADGVNVRVDGSDQLHDGLGVQCVGGAGDVLLAVKACSGGIGNGRVDNGDIGILHSGQHGCGGGGSHSHDHIHAVTYEVGTDLVQVGLVSLCICVVVGVVEGNALLCPQLIQTALHRFHDLVEGSMIHIVDDAYLEGLTALGCCGSGSGRSGGRCSHGAGSGAAAAGECQCRNGGSSHSGLEEAAAGDHGNVFHNSKLLSRSGRPINFK